MTSNLKDHRVFITAGASGIGLVVIKTLLACGARVATCDVDTQALAALRKDTPQVIASESDVADSRALGEAIQSAAREMGGLDTLINNAGSAGPTARVENIDDRAWESCLQVCLSSQFYAVRAAVPLLRQSTNPSIINFSSAAGRFGFSHRTPYAAAKWGVIGLTKSLAIELGADGIRVNAILPGLVDGDRQQRVLHAKAQAQERSFEDVKSEAFSYTSIKGFVPPQHIADQIVFLMGKSGSMISGQAISVCGDTKMLA
ncbi:MAG: SDR family oxidoreductase [Pseudomonadota bacterium]